MRCLFLSKRTAVDLTGTVFRQQVLHLSLWANAPGDGVGSYLKSVQQALNESDVESVFVALSGTNTEDGVTFEYMGSYEKHRWLNATQLALWLFRNRNRFSLVHVHGATGWPLLLGSVFSLCFRLPFVISPHGVISQWHTHSQKGLNRVFFRTIGKALLRKSCAVITTTELESVNVNEIIKKVRCYSVMPCLSYPVKNLDSENLIRASQKDVVKILFTGRLQPVKGLPVLIKALTLLRKKPRKVKLYIAGAGPDTYIQILKDEINKLGLENEVEFLGFIDRAAIQSELIECDIFALPSYSENFSYSTAEAIMAGKPVVVSDAVALSSLVTKYNCGQVFHVGSSEDMATSLEICLDKTVRDRYSANAARCAREEFSVGKMRSQLISVYREAGLR